MVLKQAQQNLAGFETDSFWIEEGQAKKFADFWLQTKEAFLFNSINLRFNGVLIFARLRKASGESKGNTEKMATFCVTNLNCEGGGQKGIRKTCNRFNLYKNSMHYYYDVIVTVFMFLVVYLCSNG